MDRESLVEMLSAAGGEVFAEAHVDLFLQVQEAHTNGTQCPLQAMRDEMAAAAQAASDALHAE